MIMALPSSASALTRGRCPGSMTVQPSRRPDAGRQEDRAELQHPVRQDQAPELPRPCRTRPSGRRSMPTFSAFSNRTSRTGMPSSSPKTIVSAATSGVVRPHLRGERLAVVGRVVVPELVVHEPGRRRLRQQAGLQRGRAGDPPADQQRRPAPSRPRSPATTTAPGTRPRETRPWRTGRPRPSRWPARRSRRPVTWPAGSTACPPAAGRGRPSAATDNCVAVRW